MNDELGMQVRGLGMKSGNRTGRRGELMDGSELKVQSLTCQVFASPMGRGDLYTIFAQGLQDYPPSRSTLILRTGFVVAFQ